MATAQQLSRRGWWGGGLGQVGAASGDLRSPCSVSWEHQLLPGLGPGGPGSSAAATPPPAPSRLQPCPGKMPEGLSAGRDESPSSDWPLRHWPLLPAKGRRFFPCSGLALWLLQIKQFYLVPSACVSAGRISRKGTFHWGGEVGRGGGDLAQLGLREAGNGCVVSCRQRM